MIEDDVRTALLPVFTGTEVIIANENGARPAGRYVTIRVDGNAHRMPAHAGPLVDPGEPIPALGARDLAAHRTGTIELQCFGVGSFDLLDTAMLRLHEEASIAAAEALNIVFGTSNDVQSVPVLRNISEFEARAIVSLPFAYTRQVSETLPFIETVQGTIAVDDLAPMPYEATIVDN